MRRIVIELTNRCNLKCQHCFSGRHGGRDDLPMDILCHILNEAHQNGFDFLSFTGGDPTVYRHFAKAVRLTAEAGYQFGFNTNGWNFPTIYSQLTPYRDKLAVITFSLDGATEATHDQLRGRGSFRRLMQAVSVCVVEELPFSFNMVVTAHNRHQLGPMAQLATRLGSRGLRFGHLLPSPLTTDQGFDLSPLQRKQVEAEIWDLARQYPISMAMGPGYHTTDLFPCGPLNLQEINVDCHGNITKCCHLSGHGDSVGQGDIFGNLHDERFSHIYQRLVRENEQFRRRKKEHLSAGSFQDTDFSPCWYCSNHYQKVGWLRHYAQHPWGDALWDAVDAESTASSPSQPIQLYEMMQ
ncbi:MAG: radical SAM protein [Anaerolineae bacterium]|nr:radical SAM protein [Anaerolineae bacterium]